MDMRTYTVTCLDCQQSDKVVIDESRHEVHWQDNKSIISARYRLDNQWGWQCTCGNNSLLTEQENNYLTDKVNPDPKEIQHIVNNLELEIETKFKMES